MKKILVVLPVEERHKRRLEQDVKNGEFIYRSVDKITIQDVRNADIIIGNVPAEYIEKSSRLKLLQLNSAGTNQYIVPGILAPETILTNATGAYGKAVGEHMFAIMMCLQKKLHRYRDDRSRGIWNDYGTVTSITDMTVLVIGLGDIGLHFAAMAKALGAYVIGIKRRVSSIPTQVDELFLMTDLEQVLPRADVIFSILPETPETHQIYNKKFFSRMKKKVFF